MKRFSEGRHHAPPMQPPIPPHATTTAASAVPDALVRKYYKICVDCVKKLDQSTKAAETVSNLFGDEIVFSRNRLRESAEKLLFHNPTEYGKRAEEIIWRKCFYDPVQLCRQKKDNLTDLDLAQVSMLISCGHGYYHSLLLRLQNETGLKFNSLQVDYAAQRLPWRKTKVAERHRSAAWPIDVAFRCMIYMGDLARYQQDFDENGPDLAMHYYHMAAMIKPNAGMPHNQLGTLYNQKCFGLDAAYCYMRCVFSTERFDGAQGNLGQILKRNEKRYQDLQANIAAMRQNRSRNFTIETFVVDYLHQIHVFYEDLKEYDEGGVLQVLCQSMLNRFELVLVLLEPHDPLWDSRAMKHIDTAILVKVVVMQLMLVKQLQDTGSMKLSASIALVLSMFSSLLRHVQQKLTRKLVIPMVESDSDSMSGSEKMGNRSKNVVTEGGSKRATIVARRRTRGSDDDDDSADSTVSNELSDCESDGEIQSNSEMPQKSVAVINSDGENNGLEKFAEISPDEGVSETPSSGSNTQVSNSHELPLSPQESMKVIETIEPNNNVSKNDVDMEEKTESVLVNGVAKSSSSGSVCEGPRHFFDLNTEEKFEELSDIGVLVLLKLLCDWLRCNPNLILSVAQSSQLLWSRFAELLNMLPKEDAIMTMLSENDSAFSKALTHDISSDVTAWNQQRPLTEDVNLRGNPVFLQVHTTLDFAGAAPLKSKLEETIVRVYCLYSFGHYLMRLNTQGFKFDRARQEFHGSSGSRTTFQDLNSPNSMTSSKKTTPISSSSTTSMSDMAKREAMMRNMGELRVKNELAQLKEKNWIPVYIVPEVQTLADKLKVLKLLAGAQKFVMVIPKCVIHELDRLKKDCYGVREALRWLETNFEKGNKFVRPQKEAEVAELETESDAVISRESKDFVECCSYLSKTIKTTVSTVVTVLSARPNNAPELDNLRQLLESTGINGVSIENVHKFNARWMTYRKKGS